MCDLDGCNKDHDTLPPLVIPAAARRRFLKGLMTLPLAAVLADPILAAAAAGRGETVSMDTAGGGKASGYLALPEADKAPAVLLIHEWWGLNDQIRAVAQELANEGFIALAVDLYDGKVASSPDEARTLVTGVDAAAATDALTSWIEWLRGHDRSTGKVATMGWCFGGGWSLNASIAAPVDGTVIYYGRVNKPADQLAALSGPVLGHFGTLDQSIDPEMVGQFEHAMDEAGKGDRLTVHWYTANHAFANPTGSRYDADDAALAWARTLAFLHRTLG